MFTNGDGSSNNPYQITNAAQMDFVRNNLFAHYILMNNIDLSSFASNELLGSEPPSAPGVSVHYTPVVIATGWIPIGTMVSPFAGSFNGNNKSITGLVFVRHGLAFNGLFGCIKNATVKDFSINCNVAGGYMTNGHVGQAKNSIISNVIIAGSVVANM